MKRRSSPCYSPDPKRVPVTESPISELSSFVQADADMNNNKSDWISNEGSCVHGNTGLDFNLNTYPADGSPPFHFPPSSFKINNNNTPQDAAQTVNEPIDVDALYPGIEVIEVEDSPPPSYIVQETVVQHQLLNVGRRVDSWTSQDIPSEINVLQSTNGGIDDVLVDYSALPFVFLGSPNQVQNEYMDAPPEAFTVDGHSAIHSGPSGGAAEEALTMLRLGLYHPETEIPVTDFFRMESGQNNQIEAVTAVAAVAEAAEEPNIPEGGNPNETKKKEAAFTCAVCWNPLKEETSTICGHIFCLECIKSSIKAQKKCPTCRRKLNRRNIHRVFLPTSD